MAVTSVNRQLFNILNIQLPFDPVVPLPGIYSRELKPYGHTKADT